MSLADALGREAASGDIDMDALMSLAIRTEDAGAITLRWLGARRDARVLEAAGSSLAGAWLHAATRPISAAEVDAFLDALEGSTLDGRAALAALNALVRALLGVLPPACRGRAATRIAAVLDDPALGSTREICDVRHGIEAKLGTELAAVRAAAKPEATPVVRELVSAYVRRFGGWNALRAAIAGELGVGVEAVDDGKGERPPVALVEAFTQHGQFQLRVQIFVDVARAPGWRGETMLLEGLARALGEEILYDDGASQNPYRWILVQPGGARFEVFEDAGRQGPDLLLDASIAPRRIVDA